MDVQADITVQIAAPPERVWEVLADVAAWPTWTDSVTSIEMLGPGTLQLGSRVKIKQPRLPVTTWTVTELEPGESFTWVATGPGVRTAASHRVEPAGSGAAATLAVAPDGPVGRLIGRLTRRLTHRYLAMEANGLRDRAEHPVG